MKTIKKRWFEIFFISVCLFALLKQCNSKPEVKTETIEVVKWKTDTVTETIIQEVPKPVYIEKLKTVKGKDSIIYKDKPTETTITANQYDTEIKSDSATARLKITTTGELLDVQGIINYPKIERTTTITKTKDASGRFIYLKTDFFNPLKSIDLGGFVHINNNFGVIIEAGYDERLKEFNNGLRFSSGIAIKF